MSNFFDEMFGDSLNSLEEAAADAQGYRIDPKGPFIKGEDLDINNEELVNELTEYAFHAPEPKKAD